MSTYLTAGALALQAAIVLVAVAALRRGNVSAAVNAAAAFGAGLLPVWLAVAGPVAGTLPLWMAAAGLLHSVGMLGLYETVWWWDHLTHTVSAALVGALAYAALSVQPPALPLGPGALTVLFVAAVGVFWELIELVAREAGERFGVEPVLVYYGPTDTAFDLAFDLVGAVLVVTLDLSLFVPVAARNAALAGTLLTAAALVTVVGSLLMALGLLLGGAGRRPKEVG